MQAQNVHGAVELAVAGAVCFNATFMPNVSEREQSGRIKAIGRWFESGQCVGAFKVKPYPQQFIQSTLPLHRQRLYDEGVLNSRHHQDAS